MKAVLTWINDNKWIVLFLVGMFALFLYIGHFSELVYAAGKFALVVGLASALVHWKFPGSIHKFISSDQFLTEFWGTTPVHRLWITIAVFIALFIVGAWVFHNV